MPLKAIKEKHCGPADSTEAVDRFMSPLEHPYKADIEALREIVMSVDPSVAEGVKWNAPSFRTTEYFATTNLRVKGGLGVILHRGAKVRDGGEFKIEDPTGLLTWLAKDRASVTFRGSSALHSNADALRAILRQWIKYV